MPRLVAGGLLPGARRRRRQPRRETPLRRPPVQLQQARPAGRQHHRRATRLHQAEAEPAHRRRKSLALGARTELAPRFEFQTDTNRALLWHATQFSPGHLGAA